MWAAAGHIPAVGPYGIVIALMLPVIAVTGTIAILLRLGRYRKLR